MTSALHPPSTTVIIGPFPAALRRENVQFLFLVKITRTCLGKENDDDDATECEHDLNNNATIHQQQQQQG